MTGGARLPYIGAQAVILGMTAFNSNAKAVDTQLQQLGRSAYYMERTSRGAFAGVSSGATSMFGILTSGAMIAAGVLASLGTAALVMGQRYAREVANVGIISEATSSQIDKLSLAQLNLSRYSTESASSLNKASGELSKAGFSIEDITGKALDAANNLVILSEGELKAADAAVAMQIGTANFGVSIDEVERITNSATAAVLRSTLTFTGYADAMRQGGGVAASYGLEIEEFAAAVGSAGLRIASGTEIGTGFRQMFLRLQNPTKASTEVMRQYGISLYDAEGAARPFRDIVISLENAFGEQAVATGRLTQAQRDHAVAALFGARAVKVVNALIDGGVESYDALTDAIKRLDASTIASQFLAQTGAKFDMIGNSANALSTAFGKGLDPVVNALATSFLNWLRSFDLQKVEALGSLVGDVLYNAFSSLGEILGPAISAYMRLSEASWRLYAALDKVFHINQILLTVLKGVGLELIVIASVFAASNDAISAFYNHIAAATTGTSAFSKTAVSAIQSFGNQFSAGIAVITNNLSRLALRTGQSFKIIEGWLASLAGYLKKILVDPWIKMWASLTKAPVDTAKAVKESASGIGSVFEGVVNIISGGVDEIGGWLSSLGQMFESLYTVVDHFGNDVFSVFNGLGEAVGALVQWFADQFGQIGSALDSFGVGVMAAVGAAIESFGVMDAAVGAFISSMIQELTRGLGFIGDALHDWLVEPIKDALQWVMDQMANAMNTVLRGWSMAWSSMGGIVGNAVNWILGKVNAMLDALISLPIVGEAIGIARAAMTQAERVFAASALVVSGTITGLVKSTAQGIKAFEDNTKKYFRNFAGELKAINDKARAARDTMLEDLKKKPHPMSPDESTEPGSIPDSGDDEKALNKLKNLLERVEEIWADFGKGLEKEQRAIAKEISKAYDDAAQGMAKAIRKANEEITEAQNDAYEARNELESDRRLEKDIQDRTKAFEEGIEIEERLRAQQFEDADALHRLDLENDAAFEAEKRQNREDEFDRYLDTLERGRARDRQDEDRVYAESQRARDEKLQHDQDIEADRLEAAQDRRERELKTEQDRLENALELAQDVREEALERQLDAQEVALKKTLEAEEAALKKSQDQREEALEKQFDIEKRARDAIFDLADINTEDAAARAEAQAEYTTATAEAQAIYNAEVAKGVKVSIAQARWAEKLAAINKDNAAKVADINKDTTGKKSELTTDQERAKADADFEAGQEARLAALRAQFAIEDAAADAAAEARTLTLKTATETQLKALRTKFDEEQLAQEVEFAKQTLELRERLERDTSDLREKHEKARDALANKLEYEALIRSREREDEDRKYAEDQSKRKNSFIANENKIALERQRTIDESERMRKRGLDNADFVHGKDIEQKKEDFRKVLDDEAYNRRIFQIGMESLERIATAKTTLSNEQELTREKLAQDIIDLQDNLRDRVATIQADYLDKLQDVVKEGGAKLQPVVDEVTGNINTALQGIRDAAKEATEALALTFEAANKVTDARAKQIGGGTTQVAGAFQMRNPDKTSSLYPEGPYSKAPAGTPDGYSSGGWSWSDAIGWYYSGDDSPSTSGSQGSFAKGGTVPGAYGAPVPITAHGGEVFEGLGGHATAMAAVRAAESMWAHGVGAAVTNYDIDYNVEANYGKVQPAGSVARDLSALAILTRN